MAIPRSLEEYIKGVPKVELHIHIEGTLEPELMFELAARNNVTIEGSVQSHKERRKNFKDLQDFLDLYYQACSVLLTEEDFYDLAFSYLKRASKDNVKVAEIFFDPQTHTERGVSYEVVIKGLHRAVMDGQRLLNIRASLILCFLRHLPQSKHFEVLQSALPHRDKIIGVGLDSGELGNEPHKFKEVFAEASKHGLKIVAHAGEEGGPGYIREALTCLHAQRIDHGIQCVFDDKLVEELVKKQVPLTVCPLSNIKLKVNSRFFDGQNKTKELLDKGLMVTVNSDDPAYFGGYITDNFIQTAVDTGLTRQDVFKICRNAINATFLSNEDREVYLNALDDFNKQN